MAIKTTMDWEKGQHERERERGGGVTGMIQKGGAEPECYVFTKNKLVLRFKHTL